MTQQTIPTDPHVDYDAIDALSWSSLAALATSPLLYQHRLDHPRPDTRALALGRLIHCAVFEPERWKREYTVQPNFGDLRYKGPKAENKAWLESLPDGVTIVSGPDSELAEACAAALHQHKHAKKLITNGRAEVTIEWTTPTERAAKARLDYLLPTRVVDLKSTQNINPRIWSNDVARYLYHGQIAWYHDGAMAAGLIKGDENPAFVVIEKTEPYDCGVRLVTDEVLDAGRNLYRNLLDMYEQCTAANWWPGQLPEPLPLDLPPWAPGIADGFGGTVDEEW